MIEKVADRRAIREEDLERRRIAVSAAKAQLNDDRAVLTRGQAALAQLRSDLSRLMVVAPIDGEILKVDVHPGEYAVVPSPSPLIAMSDTSTMHLRADVAEKDASRFIPGRTAYASPRGAGGQRIPLTFVRVEPRILPKGNFTADTVERIDTRVLQFIYRVSGDAHVYDGELMDVYIDAPERIPVTEKGKAFLAARVRGAQDRTVHLGEAVESAERASLLAKALYGAGEADFLSVLDAHREFLDTQRERVQAQTDAAISTVAHHRALGGGWRVPETTSAILRTSTEGGRLTTDEPRSARDDKSRAIGAQPSS
jgi:hypothetical protein